MTDYSAHGDLFREVSERVRARYSLSLTPAQVEGVVAEYCEALSHGLRGLARMKDEQITIGGSNE